jgi:ABC-type branched-subunit amino acid transport system substrate-binding protein
VAFYVNVSSAVGTGIKIGVDATFSGPSEYVGQQIWLGATLAANDINGSGGINGQEIKLESFDDQMDPKRAFVAAEKFENDGVVLSIGYFGSYITAAAADAHEKYDSIMITVWSPAFIPKSETWNLFNLSLNSDQICGPIVGEVRRKFPGKKFSFGLSFQDVVRNDPQDISIVPFEGLKSPSPEQFDPKGVVVAGSLQVPFTANAEIKHLVEESKSKGHHLSYLALRAYAGIQGFARAARDRNTIDPRKISEQFRTGVNTILGKISFDSSGRLLSGVTMSIATWSPGLGPSLEPVPACDPNHPPPEGCPTNPNPKLCPPNQ